MTNKINHEKRNRSERVKNYRAKHHGLDAYTGSEYLSKREERRALERLQNSAPVLATDPFSNSFRRLWDCLGGAHQEIAFKHMSRLPGVSIESTEAPAGIEIELSITVRSGDPECVREKVVLILETLLDTKRSITDKLIARLSPKASD